MLITEEFTMSPWRAYLDDIRLTFGKWQEMAERALVQVSDETFFHKPGEFSNSIAAIVKHVGGNLASRWTDFLTSDGEKPWRNRDSEFVTGPEEGRASVEVIWKKGWAALFGTLDSLREDDLLKKIRIRDEELTVFQATHRSLTHTSYHVGQIVYLARLLTKDDWKWLTIPPGESKLHSKGAYLK
jgi:hypothetical protein